MKTPSSAISTRILTAVAKGKSVAEAIDEVLGAGTHAALVDSIYEELRKKAAKVQQYSSTGA